MTIKVKASIIGIRILSFLIILELIFFITLLYNIKPTEILPFIIVIILVLIFMIGLPIKYLLWNKYGQEFLIINTKSVSWHYDFGFFTTNVNTELFDHLAIGFENIRGVDENEIGRLIFYNYRKLDDLPVIIHQTTALITSSEVDELSDMILNLFVDDANKKNGFIPFSSN